MDLRETSPMRTNKKLAKQQNLRRVNELIERNEKNQAEIKSQIKDLNDELLFFKAERIKLKHEKKEVQSISNTLNLSIQFPIGKNKRKGL